MSIHMRMYTRAPGATALGAAMPAFHIMIELEFTACGSDAAANSSQAILEKTPGAQLRGRPQLMTKMAHQVPVWRGGLPRRPRESGQESGQGSMY